MSETLNNSPEKPQSWIKPWTWNSKRWIGVGAVTTLLILAAA
jgi:hypothetical protein